MAQESASRGVGRRVTGPQDRGQGSGLAASEQWGSWAGGSQGGGVKAESNQEPGVSRTEVQEQGKGCPTSLLTQVLLLTGV